MGNRFSQPSIWRQALTGFDKRRFETPQMLAQAAADYFEWATNNPLYEEKHFAYKGDVTTVDAPKVRAFSLRALCTFCGISMSAYHGYRSRAGYEELCNQIDDIIYTQKFEAGAAGLLNSTIVVRDLGLTEKTQTEDVTPIKSEEELREQARRLGIDPAALGLGGGSEEGDQPGSG